MAFKAQFDSQCKSCGRKIRKAVDTIKRGKSQLYEHYNCACDSVLTVARYVDTAFPQILTLLDLRSLLSFRRELSGAAQHICIATVILRPELPPRRLASAHARRLASRHLKLRVPPGAAWYRVLANNPLLRTVCLQPESLIISCASLLPLLCDEVHLVLWEARQEAHRVALGTLVKLPGNVCRRLHKVTALSITAPLCLEAAALAASRPAW
jgi:hypothetical protein